MKQLTPEMLEEAGGLLTELRSGRLEDSELSEVVIKLNALLPDPHWFSYAIDQVSELSADGVVRKAFEYRPFLMPGLREGTAP